MQTYNEFAPTMMDPKGLGLPDRQDWVLAPVSQTRDSESLARSNFRVVLEDLGGVGDDVEVHRFGHWGPGWFELILVRPDTEAAKKAEQWEAALADYPVASDEDFSREEAEDQDQDWVNWLAHDIQQAIERGLGIDDYETVIGAGDVRKAFEASLSAVGGQWHGDGVDGQDKAVAHLVASLKSKAPIKAEEEHDDDNEE